MRPHEIIKKATAALAESVGSIINNDDSTEAEKVRELAKTFAQAEGFLLDELPDGMIRTGDFLKQLEYEGDLRHAIKEAEAEDRAKGDDYASTSDHHASKAADLLVESGKFPHRAAALDHLLHHRDGAALLRRLKKHQEESNTMTKEQLEAARVEKLKALGDDAITIAKSIVAKDESFGLDEHDWTSLVTAHAKRMYPDLTEAQAFEKVFAAPTEEGRLLREAHAVVRKDMMATFTPIAVDGVNPDDAQAAVQALKRLVEEQRSRAPWMSAEAAWDAAMRARPDLAARAIPRPEPTTAYPMPR